MQHRWYDKDPAVSLALSLLKNSNTKTIKTCTEHVLNRTKDAGVTISHDFLSEIHRTIKRWYDENKDLSEAMEYLRVSSDKLKKEIALELIEILQIAETN